MVKNNTVKNYQLIPQKNIFKNDLFKINYNLALIRKLEKEYIEGSIDKLERRYGKRNAKLFLNNKSKFATLIFLCKNIKFSSNKFKFIKN